MLKYNLLLCTFFVAISISHAQDDRAIINKIDSINSLALSYYNNNDIMQSINAFNEAITLSDSINDGYGSAIANFTIGKIYGYMKDFDAAERCYKKMLFAAHEINDNYLIANSYLSLGKIYEGQQLKDKAIYNYKNGLAFAKMGGVFDHNNIDKQQNVLFNIKMNLTGTLLDLGNTDEALIYLIRADDNLNFIEFNTYNEGFLSFIYGRYFLDKGLYFKANEKFAEAVNYLKNSMHSNELDYIILISKVYKEYSYSLAQNGNNDMAYTMLLMHNEAREKIINEEKVKQENIAKSKFYISEYKRIAILANKEKLLQEQVTAKMQKINLFITIAGILLLISLITLYKNYLSKQKLSDILEARNKQLEIAKNEAEKSSQLKSNFISNVTHELRTPLYGVVGLTSLLLKSNELNERDSKFLKSLKFSGDYLLNLVNDILQIGKIESQKIESHKVSVNLRSLLENIIGSLEYKTLENNNKMELIIDEKVPELVQCDNVQLSQILLNLLGNSIKFTKNGKITLGVEVLGFPKNDVCLKFSVKDNGPGIPKSKQKTIFENFSQLNEKDDDNYQGTGLGLSIAKNLVHLLGGEIRLKSEEGQGSEFSFDATLQIDSHANSLTTKKKADTIIPIHEKRMILVAEDNKINQIVTQNILQKGNFECQIVDNGLEALNAIKENGADHYDLILMDINMPVMNGKEATKNIKTIDSNIPIIALTAADIEEVKNDFETIGFDDIITKPFDNYEFFQKITASIQKSKRTKSFNNTLTKVS